MKISQKFFLILFLFASASVTFSHAEVFTHRTLIDEIKVEGIQTDWIESVKAMSSYFPGDEPDTTKTDRSMIRIKDYLENKGYPNAKVTVEFNSKIIDKEKRNIFAYQVKLGDPVRVIEINYLTQNGTLSPEQVQRLRLISEIKRNEAFDRDRIKETRRSIESALALMSFVDSRVTKIDTEPNTEGVKVTFEIELGQQVVFSVQGNEFFVRSELMTLIEEQRLAGLGRDYVSVLMSRLRDRYVDNGFRAVKIIPYAFELQGEPRKVVFMIEEGYRSKIKKIVFDGNEIFSSEMLENIFFKNASDRIQSRIYNEKMSEDAAKSMIDELKHRGYLSAKLIALKSEELNNSGDVRLNVFLSEGLQTRIQRIELRGQTVLSSDRLIEILGLHENDPMNLVSLEDGIDRIKKEYRNLGYLDFKIENELASNQNYRQILTYSEKNQFVDLNIEMSEGVLYRLSEVRVFGNNRTNSKIILREVQVKQGEVLSEGKVLETEDKLRRLGIFSQVTLELIDDPDDRERKALKITVQEATPGNLGFGAGYRNDLGVRIFGEATYANLWGENHTWVLNMSGNRRLDIYRFVEYSAQASYIWPWVFLGETTFRPSLTTEKRQYIQFDAQTLGFSASFDRTIWKKFGLGAGITYSLEQIRQFNAANSVDDQQIRIGAITPLLRLDLRDHPLIPHRGLFALASFEYSRPEFGSQGDPIPVSYGRFQLRTDWYLDFVPRVVWYTSVRGGWLRNFANTYGSDGRNNPQIAVPLIKQFALGGVNSLRGFLQQEINVQDQVIQGYSTFTNYRTQMDYFVSQNLSLGPFVDAGNLKVNDFNFGTLRYGAGVGLRYTTPVGPVNFDWGFKLFPKPGEQLNVFYFSLGVI